MGALIKNVTSTYIPGDPGQAGSPYVPAKPASWAYVPTTVCSDAGVPVIKAVKVYPDGPFLLEQLGLSTNGGTTGVQLLGAVDVDANNDGVPEYTQFIVQLSGGVCTTTEKLVYTPPTAAIPAVPYAAPTPAQITVSLNQGWNSYARTVGQLLPGAYIEYTVKYGSYAALLAVGTAGMEGVAIAAFPYGIMVDTSGIYQFESGVASALAPGNTPGLLIRIARLADGRIVYSVGGEAVSISAVGTYTENEELYVYGLLYSGYDEVTTAEFKTGEMAVEADVTMYGAGSLVALPMPYAMLDGYGDLLVVFDTAVRMDGYGALTAEFSSDVAFLDADLTGTSNLMVTLEGGGHASFSLLAMQFLASDAASEYLGYGSTELPLFTITGTEAAFVPAAPTSGYFNLPFFVAWGNGSETEHGDGATDLPAYLFQASEGEYGIGDLSLPTFYSSGSGGFIAEDELTLFSVGAVASQQAHAIDLVLILNSSGELTSSLSMTREQALALLSVLQHSSSFSMLGVYGMSMLSSLHGLSLETMSVGTSADLYDDGAVWVVNLDSNASVQYEQYGFNSFFQRGNDYYGVANDGIYKLSGDTDNGDPIDALVEFARTNLGSTQAKRLSAVYLAAAGDALILKVVTPGRTNLYTARWGGADMRNQRVAPGKGLQSAYWQFSVLNQDGADFELGGLEFLPIVTQRRV